ncbi:T9SS type B sorting domain-containing protein [Flavobacterium luteum]|uniref:T9SS type B sorting domain-containing protein n=1 Tax=Flavobacterium luteum TaxID=2026654 RepID=A0A7J5AKP7_9FLAO|nr:T9SS type B sorting domain-containing protein [Flavobacterium luteum]KAB1158177.1 T9SS type B sorting domain-containing protein [Flavobacterium luteum]
MTNRILYIILFLFTFNCFSQAIVVDETTYSVPELVSKILVNSKCLQATKITSSTGTKYGAGNGIGYFETTNPDFPIKKGVILSTGSVKNAPGPNTTIQSDGNSSWLGDTDLDNTMAAAGVPLVSTNATILEFDFVPISTKFSFDFLFASEEYGNFQCEFGDAFAYLLTNTVTNVTTNLAVVPSTVDPISVVTIRNNAYLGTCPSVNENFFDNYYGGALAAGAATNFEGNTVKMTASAVLVPNVKYHIKLVIADRSNYENDSAIFLSSQTFNLSENVLGPDYTIDNNKAICIGDFAEDLTTGLDPLFYSFVWKKNGIVIPGQTGPNLTGITGGNYSVIYTNFKNICEPITDNIFVETYPAVLASNPLDIYKCNIGSPTYSYDISSNTPKMLVGSGSPLVPIQISYHISLADANSGSSPLSSPYDSPDNVTIYARIVNQTTGCHIVKTFKLLTSTGTIANKPKDLTECSLTGIAPFNLASNLSLILNGQSPLLNIVSFHSSQSDADNDLSPLPTNYASSGGTVYVRVENRDDPTCYSTTSFELFVSLVQPLDVLPPVFVCGSYTLPKLVNGFYFEGTKGTLRQFFEGDIITPLTIPSLKNIVTIFIFDPLSPCIPLKENSLIITFVDIPLITPKNQIVCDNEGYALPGLTYGNYYSLPNGTGDVLTGVIKTPQTIYTYFQSLTDPTCITSGVFKVDTIVSPILPEFANTYDCLSYKLPPLSVGKYFNALGSELLPGTAITADETITVEAKTNTKPICTDTKSFKVFIGTFPYPKDPKDCVKFKLPDLPVGTYHTAPNGLGDIVPFGTEINVTTSLYVYVPADANSNCPSFDEKITITIELPPLSNPNDVSKAYCDSYTLLPLTNGNYFKGSDGSGKPLFAGDDIKKTTPLYIYISDGNKCKNEIPFTITINPNAKVDNRASLDFCGGVNYPLTPMSVGSVGNYYKGPLGTGGKLLAGDVITKTKTIYIYGTTTTVPPCPVENYFTLTFTPRVDISADISVCENYILPVLTEGEYYTLPSGQGTKLIAGDIIDTNQTIYIYNEYPNRKEICTDESSFTVTITRPIVNNTTPTNKIYCDEDGVNDGSILIDSTTLKEDILIGQPEPSANYNIKYYNTVADAIIDKNPITTVKTQDVYYKINNVLTPNCFSIVNKIGITINKIPLPDPNEGLICVNISNTVVINSGLPIAPENVFEWFNNDANDLMPSETSNEITVSVPDIYAVKVTNTLTTCSSQKIAVTVVRSSPPLNIELTTTSLAFDENQVVTVLNPGGEGDYEYQLDSGPFQSSPVFEGIKPGIHDITVRDKNGCGLKKSETFSIINYLKYFTPNADGYNDTWNIIGLKDPEASISIFDRHGKLIKQISPIGTGWDGNYNNKPLPSSDYWFKVTYFDDLRNKKEFQAHFSLKR